jgi:hypothetical protein
LDCVTGYYCDGNACSSKKADGDLCSSGTQCTSGTCGGRCCAGGCTCTQPSTANIIKNAGFDRNLSGWSFSNAGIEAKFDASTDAEGCPFSGSVSAHMGIENVFDLEECLPVMANTSYNFGGRAYLHVPPPASADNASYFSCYLGFYSDANCGTEVVGDPGGMTNNSSGLGWVSVAGSATAPGSAVAVKITCAAGSDSADPSGLDANVDMVYMTPAPGHY